MRIVSVAGSSPCSDGEAAFAYEVGKLLGERGVAVACGGRQGVMEHVCRGAHDAGGLTIGFLPGADASHANGYVDLAIPTALGETRNALVAHAGEAIIAIGKGFGTLSEIALALKIGRRVVGLGSWELGAAREAPVDGYTLARSPEEAVRLALGD